MKFIIRDDDTCALTSVNELELCYRYIKGEIPVCLSVTPFMIPGDFFNVKYEDRNKQIPLGTNPELVSFLKEGIHNGSLDVAMHGYTHIYHNNEIPEYYIQTDDLFEKTRHGKTYLENLLSYNINTFVPPSNMISKEGIEAVAKNKMNLIGSPSFWRPSKRPFHLSNYLNAMRRLKWKIKNGNSRYPFVIDAGTHKEIEYYLLYPSTDLNVLKAELDFCHSVNGVFILSTHYIAFHKKIRSGETIKQALSEIINYVSGKRDVTYITYRDLW